MINDFFGYEVEFDMDSANIFFYIENNDDSILPKIIKETLNKDLLNEDILKQVKRRYIGLMYDVFNDIESFNSGYIRDYLSGLDFFKALNDLRSITLKDVEKCREYLSCPHTSYVSMISKW